MKVVVDSNILFSALLKADAKLAEIILNPAFNLEKISCYFLYIELFRHKEKMLRISKLSEEDILDVFYRLMKKITFINEETITDEDWQQAEQLTTGVDEKDMPFVALAISQRAVLWTGDRRLLEGLQAQGFEQVIDTATLLNHLNLS